MVFGVEGVLFREVSYAGVSLSGCTVVFTGKRVKICCTEVTLWVHIYKFPPFLAEVLTLCVLCCGAGGKDSSDVCSHGRQFGSHKLPCCLWS